LWNESYIQITAAINSGNSGGPSLNAHGEVIGINTAMVSKAQNIGYIIPINDVKSVISDLRTNKLLRKPIFGSAFNKSTLDMTNYLGNPSPGGFYIAQVYKNTLFEMAGIKAGDMLYKINDYTFDKYGETNVAWTDDKVPLVSVLNRFNVGKKVDIQIYRRGEKKEVSLNFNVTDPLPIRTMYPEFEAIDYEIIGGMVVMPLSLNLVNYFDDKFPEYAKYQKRENQYTSRLIITHIFHDSQAREARSVKKGLLIKKINDIEVFTLDDFRQAIEKDPEYLGLQTENNLFMALSMKKVLEEEDELSQRNYYQKTDLVKKLQNKLLK
jgi:serine protease Do